MKEMKWLLTAACVLSLAVSPAQAAKRVDPDKLPKVACADLKFGAAFLEKYPKAPAACLEGREYKGKRYAKFRARVYISDPAFMTVELLNATDMLVTAFSFKPAATQHVLVGGEEKKFSDLKVGEVMTVWVSEDRMTAFELPGSTKDSWAVLPPR